MLKKVSSYVGYKEEVRVRGCELGDMQGAIWLKKWFGGKGVKRVLTVNLQSLAKHHHKPS
jgi:hypothetical protein